MASDHRGGLCVLIIEDQHDIAANIWDFLERRGHVMDHCADGVSGLVRAIGGGFDVIVLDLGLRRLDGLDLCRQLRAAGHGVPVLMLTARDTLDNKLAGFDSGADDYLMKPFSLKELLARVRALLRRRERGRTVPDMLQIGAAVVDFRKGTLARGGREFPLSEKESGMLRLLAASAGEAVSREKFLDVVWGYHANPSARTVDNFIAGLRAKLEEDAGNPRCLVTVRGVGYRLER